MLLLAALVLMPAAFLYCAVKMGLSPLNAVCLALLISTVASSLCWGFEKGFDDSKQMLEATKQDFFKQLTVVEEQLKEKKSITEDSHETFLVIRENFGEALEKASLLFPTSLLFMWHMFTLLLLYYGVAWLAPKFGYEVQPMPAVKDWRFGWNLIWLYIAGWVMFFFLGYSDRVPGTEVFRVIGANCLMTSNVLYFVAGFALLLHAFNRFKIGLVSRVGLSIIALVFSQFVVWFGIIDVWADFRAVKIVNDVSDGSDDDIF